MNNIPSRLLRETDALSLRPEGRSRFLAQVRDGLLPAMVKVSSRMNAWAFYELDLANRMDLAAGRMPEREFRIWCDGAARDSEASGLAVGAWFWRRADYLVELNSKQKKVKPTEYRQANPAMTGIIA